MGEREREREGWNNLSKASLRGEKEHSFQLPGQTLALYSLQSVRHSQRGPWVSLEEAGGESRGGRLAQLGRDPRRPRAVCSRQ